MKTVPLVLPRLAPLHALRVAVARIATVLAATLVSATAGHASEDDVTRWLAESAASAEAAVVSGISTRGSADSTAGSAGSSGRSEVATRRSAGSIGSAHESVAGPPNVAESLAQAEEAYRARRWARAFDAYQTIVAGQPDHALAWLRIGNLQQRRRQWLQAASAYRKAAREDGVLTGASDTSHAALDEIRAKALMNLAMVNLELAAAALAQIDRLPAHLADAQAAAATAVQRVRDVVERTEAGPVRALSRNPGPRREAPGGARGYGPAAPSAARAPRPEIEYLQGAPAP